MVEAAHLTVQSVEVLAHRIPLTVVVRVQRADGTDVNLDECAAVSGPLAEALEASGLLTMAYVLEVSSPGIGEELLTDRDFVITQSALSIRRPVKTANGINPVFNWRSESCRIPTQASIS